MQFKHHSQHPISSGFTLVELLVVISIVALLVAALLPALHAARERANQITDLNFMHQEGIVFRMYSNDNKDTLPNGPASDGNFNYSFVFDQFPELLNNYSAGNPRMWVCPEFKVFGSAATDLASLNYYASIGGGYGQRFPGIYADGNLFCGNDPQYDVFFKSHLPNSGWPHYYLTGRNSFDAVSGRWIIRSEQMIADNLTWGAGIGAFGDHRHGAGYPSIPPTGTPVLWTDLAADWSKNYVNWANVYYVGLQPN